jgi:hypothetical protein
VTPFDKLWQESYPDFQEVAREALCGVRGYKAPKPQPRLIGPKHSEVTSYPHYHCERCREKAGVL